MGRYVCWRCGKSTLFEAGASTHSKECKSLVVETDELEGSPKDKERLRMLKYQGP